MRTVKRHVTLIEILVAVALMSIILAALGYFYKQIDYIGRELEKTESNSFRMRYLENRLAEVIPKAIPDKDLKEDFFFYSSADSMGLFKDGTHNLTFIYDNGVNLDKQFSNNVLARLFVDRQSRLVLATWPVPKRWPEGMSPPIKLDILAENVTGLNFKFFVSPEKGKGLVIQSTKIQEGKDLMDPEPKGTWIDEWKFEYQQLPPLIKIILRKKPDGKSEETVTYAFSLPNSDKHLIYEQ